ncbi:hypothetical protein TL08_25535 [Actinoalloteichus hymeniacidonis]|uniref:Uncharacterized protein n=2 Tax=Actinoalloteichus hymeniacidonis TaxID=340345 RepID=A0AAC9HUV5_9PSEU|nr:hypothetical protein TL08_25535 [Actinoalloteichus hymeniacidonis]
MAMGLLLASGSMLSAPAALGAEQETSARVAASVEAAPQTVRDIDWRNSEFPVSEVGGCPPAIVSFEDGQGVSGDWIYRFAPEREIVFADVGLGREAALLVLQCGPPNSEFSTAVVAMDVDEAGTITALGTVGNKDSWEIYPADIAVFYGDVAIRFQDFGTDEFFNEYYRYSPGEGFVQL